MNTTLRRFLSLGFTRATLLKSSSSPNPITSSCKILFAAPAAYGNCSLTSAHPPWKYLALSKMCMEPPAPLQVPSIFIINSAMIASGATPLASAWVCSR